MSHYAPHPSGERKRPHPLFFAVLPILIAVLGWSTYSTWSMVGKVFPGFLIYPNGLVSPYAFDWWSGSQPGIRLYDEVISWANKPFSGAKRFYADLQNIPAGTDLAYSLLQGDNRLDVSVKNARFSRKDALVLSVVAIAPGFLIFLSALLALWWNRVRGAWIIGAAGMCFGIYEICTAEYFLGGDTTWLLLPAVSLTIPLSVHYVLAYPLRKRILVEKRPLLVATYAWFPLALAGYASGLRTPRHYMWTDVTLWFVGCVVMLWMLISHLETYGRAKEPLLRRRARSLVVGFTVGFLVGLATMVLTFLWEINVFPLVGWALVPPFFAMSYSVYLGDDVEKPGSAAA